MITLAAGPAYHYAVQAVDTSSPSLARAYDYLLGGRANFTADRALAGRLRALYPATSQVLSLSRAFLASSVTDLARAGVEQFIDVGCGLPTRPSVHEAVLRVRPDARVVQVDRDPSVVSHATALLSQLPPAARVRFIVGDLTEPEALIWALRPLVDLAKPACLSLALVVQALDPGLAQAVVGVLIRALAPGSHVVLTCGHGAAGRLPDAISGTGLTAQDMTAFLAGLDIQPPGVAPLPQPQRDPGAEQEASDQPGLVLCAVGRKP
jgi:O-methyltransferase involved in polyketide biosynthesis